MAMEQTTAKLSHLYLSRTLLPAAEVHKSVVIARMLKLNTSLVCLDLSKCALSDSDAENITRALAVNTTLRSLSLASNQLKWEGGVFFSKYL